MAIKELLSPAIPGAARERRIIAGCMVWAGFWLLVDQLTKALVARNFVLGESWPVIPGCFSLTYVVNYGAAWNILDGYGVVLLIIALAVTVLALLFLRYLTDGYPERYLAIFTVLSGVIGNSIDRLWRGAVVDFFSFYLGNWHYPVFNVADCAICGGVILYVLSSFLRPERRRLRTQ